MMKWHSQSASICERHKTLRCAEILRGDGVEMAKAKANPAQDAKAAFKETAAGRVNRAAQVLRSIGALGHIKRYDYTKEQAEVVYAFLTAEVTKMRRALLARFDEPGAAAAQTGFTFEGKHADETGKS